MSDLKTAAEALLYVIDQGGHSQGEYLNAVEGVRSAVVADGETATAEPVVADVPAADVPADAGVSAN